jgi:hypothetical protein
MRFDGRSAELEGVEGEGVVSAAAEGSRLCLRREGEGLGAEEGAAAEVGVEEVGVTVEAGVGAAAAAAAAAVGAAEDELVVVRAGGVEVGAAPACSADTAPDAKRDSNSAAYGSNAALALAVAPADSELAGPPLPVEVGVEAVGEGAATEVAAVACMRATLEVRIDSTAFWM